MLKQCGEAINYRLFIDIIDFIKTHRGVYNFVDPPRRTYSPSPSTTQTHEAWKAFVYVVLA